jgi:hypothetical protein
MTNHATDNSARTSAWQLLTEREATSLTDGDRQLLVPLMDTLQHLDLQPSQSERIHEAFAKALTRALCAGETESNDSVRLRIWVLDPHASSGSWSFFLVEKQSSVPASDGQTVQTQRLVELFLYQERKA